jgi:putative membrane protein
VKVRVDPNQAGDEVEMSELAENSKPIPTSNELALQRTDLAVERTQMASDRTLMAWLRTSLSMISFGFTIYKFLQEMARAEKIGLRDNGPRNLGLTLIGLGTLALVVASYQHWNQMKQLQAQATVGERISLVLIISIAISLLGALLFFGIVLKTGPF